MKRFVFATVAAAALAGTGAVSVRAEPLELVDSLAGPEDVSTVPSWSYADIATIKRWGAMAPRDALPEMSSDALDAAMAKGDPSAVNAAAQDFALTLARRHLLGFSSASARTGWHIEDTDKAIDLESRLDAAHAAATLDLFFAGLRPRHEEYAALRAGYDRETDPQARETLARNMERWRWLPRDLGDDYVLVNAAAFSARLWRDGKTAGEWRVIVGKKSTPTPVFNTKITGVVLNPWWEIPASIVRESVGALVRNRPAAARARGYVVQDGRYRQKPGPNNALGQMKLVMPNPYSVYMHDTPSKQLFERDVRAFSHGCIRTGDAIGYAATLLEGVKTREEVDAIVESRKTTTVSLAQSLPLYITYFTAVRDADGGVRILDDIYGRDGRISVAEAPIEACKA